MAAHLDHSDHSNGCASLDSLMTHCAVRSLCRIFVLLTATTAVSCTEPVGSPNKDGSVDGAPMGVGGNGGTGGSGGADGSGSDAVSGNGGSAPTDAAGGSGGQPDASQDRSVVGGTGGARDSATPPPDGPPSGDAPVTCSGATPDYCGGRCTNFTTDPQNCGSCGKPCSIPNAESSCVGGQCVITKCTGAFSDCEPNAAGCETDVSSSRDHCGGCGRSCLGGLCGNRVCQPQHLWASDGAFTRTLVVDGDRLYFRRAKSPELSVLSRIQKNGAQQAAEDLTSVDTGILNGLAIAGGHLYWPVAPSEIHGCPLPNCGAPQSVVRNQNGVVYVFSNPLRSRLFWLNEDGNMATTIMSTISLPIVLAQEPQWIPGINTDDDHVYYIAGPESSRVIRRVPTIGGDPVTIGTAPASFVRLAVNSRDVFVFGAMQGTTSSEFWSAIFKYSKTQSAQTPQVVGVDRAGSLACAALIADEANVYWMDLQDSSVRILKCATAGCGNSPTVLATVPVDFPDGGMTMDGEAIYWATDRGIYKVPKN
jgi:hypothetical protein